MDSRLRAAFLSIVPLVVASVLALAFGGSAIIAPPPVSALQVEPAPRAPAPSATATTCQTGPRYGAAGVEVFDLIPGAGPGVALTFDMGGRMEPAVDIMNFLVANRVCATIFATGVMSDTAPGREVMAIIKANPGLFEIGNHTMYHCDLVRGGGGSPTTGPCQTGGAPSADFIRKELTDAEAILRAGTGQNPQPYWRPPYGSINQAVIDAAASVGYTKTFLWDIDTIDWKPVSDGGPTAQQIATKVIGNAVNGSNVLFHLGGYETLESLRLIVPELRARGLLPTTLSHLLAGVDEVFTDIHGSKFHQDILWIYDRGITVGCTSDRYCPHGVVTRAQLATFFTRALNLPRASRDYFTDDAGNKHEDRINRLAEAGITVGCGGTRFCPDGTVTREQMATFLVRGFDLAPSGIDHYTDDDDSKHEDRINALAASGITRGCGPSVFCPSGAVTRGQMAAFLHRALTR